MEDYKEYSSEDSDYSIFEDEYYIHEEIVRYCDNKESISKSDALEKASRFIFAEDLVGYISLKFHGYVYTTKVNKGSENQILSYPFNEVVRSAVQCIRWQIITTNCPSLEIIEKLVKSCTLYYRNFVDAILGQYSVKGLSAGVFLYFCVYFSELASKCYTPDFEEILDYAVYAILDAFCMFNEGTHELNKVSNVIVHQLKGCPVYPNCTSISTVPEISVERSGDNSNKDKVLSKNVSVLEGEFVESLSALEFKLTDKSNKLEILSNLDSQINIERLTKYMGTDRDNVLSFMDKDCIEQKNEVNLTENQKTPSNVNIQNYEDFKEEFMAIIESEARLFSEWYLSHKNQQKPDSPKAKHSKNEEENLKLNDLSNLPNTDKKHSDVSQHSTLQTCFMSQVEIQQDIKRECINPNDTLGCKTVHEVMQDQLSTNPERNNTHLGKNLTQTECESGSADTGLSFVHTDATPVVSQDPQNLSVLAIYKREGELNEENLNILKGDSLLFAVDLIRYVSGTFYDIFCAEVEVEEYRSLFSNQFNETVKEVAQFVHEASEAVNETVFHFIKAVGKNRTDCYRRYVAAVLSHYAQVGLNSNAFLYYCLHFCELASKLHKFDTGILGLALCSILDAFCCLKDDWKEFNAATYYVLTRFKTKTYMYENSYVDKFEKECVDTILGSLKEISRFRRELALFDTTKTVSA